MLFLAIYFIAQDVLCLASSLILLVHLVHTNGMSPHKAYLKSELAQNLWKTGHKYYKLLEVYSCLCCPVLLPTPSLVSFLKSIFLPPPRGQAILHSCIHMSRTPNVEKKKILCRPVKRVKTPCSTCSHKIVA